MKITFWQRRQRILESMGLSPRHSWNLLTCFEGGRSVREHCKHALMISLKNPMHGSAQSEVICTGWYHGRAPCICPARPLNKHVSKVVVEVSAGATCWLNQREEHGIFCATLHAAFLRFVSGLLLWLLRPSQHHEQEFIFSWSITQWKAFLG